MVDPIAATLIVISFIIIFGVGIPILNAKAQKFVSYRWCVIVVMLALLIGAVVDFEVLSDEARRIVLMGGMIVSGIYVVLRTLEKILSKGWLKGAQIEVEKGDFKTKVSSTDNKGEEQK